MEPPSLGLGCGVTPAPQPSSFFALLFSREFSRPAQTRQGIVATIACVAYNFVGFRENPLGDLRTRARFVARWDLLEWHDPSFGTERPQDIRPPPSWGTAK